MTTITIDLGNLSVHSLALLAGLCDAMANVDGEQHHPEISEQEAEGLGNIGHQLYLEGERRIGAAQFSNLYNQKYPRYDNE